MLVGCSNGLGGGHHTLHHQQVEACLQRHAVVALDLLRRQRPCGEVAGSAELLDALADQLLSHRLVVGPLETLGRIGPGLELGELGQDLLRLVVAGPEPLEVEHALAAELRERSCGLRRGRRVQRRGDERQVVAVGVQLPGDVDPVT